MSRRTSSCLPPLHEVCKHDAHLVERLVADLKTATGALSEAEVRLRYNIAPTNVVCIGCGSGWSPFCCGGDAA